MSRSTTTPGRTCAQATASHAHSHAAQSSIAPTTPDHTPQTLLEDWLTLPLRPPTDSSDALASPGYRRVWWRFCTVVNTTLGQ